MSRFGVSFPSAMRRLAEVSRTPFFYVNVVPHRFHDISTRAEIDDAQFIWPKDGIRRAREHVRFTSRISFDQIKQQKMIRLGFRTDTEQFIADFEVRFNSRPIPNCDLVALLKVGAVKPRYRAYA
jgi:hypothetical protein